MKTEYIFTEIDCPIILRHLYEQYEATCEICGDKSEEADEAKALYRKVFVNSFENTIGDVIGFYLELSDAVATHGGVRECYQFEPDLVEMVKRARGVESLKTA